ncbi:hypothetical protein E1292_04250 [Nonomuraea deserti]|uniref:Uncharacterized protein n=1 Tax=Nonomuraea deserti TaxID=1848322 RepID=A0A4R4W950_9ACTN|nr:hypothetical protein [Nonomuraea deserti]TDD11735.1 hypothetical protein E1292_04250 [Nonomuraea deserti]
MTAWETRSRLPLFDSLDGRGMMGGAIEVQAGPTARLGIPGPAMTRLIDAAQSPMSPVSPPPSRG